MEHLFKLLLRRKKLLTEEIIKFHQLISTEMTIYRPEILRNIVEYTVNNSRKYIKVCEISYTSMENFPFAMHGLTNFQYTQYGKFPKIFFRVYIWAPLSGVKEPISTFL